MDDTILSAGDGQPVALGEDNSLPAKIELFPIGEIALRHRDGAKGPVIGKVTDPERLIATSMKYAAAGMMPIDFDHALDDGGSKDGRAAGWITGLEVVGDKIVASVDWTVAGREALQGKLYRFISPVFYTNPTNGEVTHLARAGLTNYPALPELKQVASAPDTPLDGLCRSLAAALDLDATASVDEIVAGLLSRPAGTPATTAAPSGEGDPVKMVPLEVVATYLAEQRKEADAQTAAAKVGAAMEAGRLPPALKSWGLDLYNSDPALFDRFVATSPFDLSGELLKGMPPAAITASAPVTQDHRASICQQLGLPDGALDD